MAAEKKSSYFLLALLGGLFLLFVIVLIGFALVWEGDEGITDGAHFGRFTKSNSIGIVEIEGPIFYSQDIVDTLERYRKDDHIRAVVVRVDSPGGGVAPSQEIYDEILRVREDGKPVVASMGSLAASGGYYVASAANSVVANPGTMTGSIGVIMEFANFEELLGKIGVKAVTLKNSKGRFKDIGSPNRKMLPEEERLLKDLMDNVYKQFVEDVANGRGMDPKDIYPLADGRIFSGEQAMEAGLVDELGGFEVAVQLAAEIANIEDEDPPRVYPREPKESFFDFLKDMEDYGKSFLPGAGAKGATVPMSGGLYFLFVP